LPARSTTSVTPLAEGLDEASAGPAAFTGAGPMTVHDLRTCGAGSEPKNALVQLAGPRTIFSTQRSPAP
jgi:hypothetical protein